MGRHGVFRNWPLFSLFEFAIGAGAMAIGERVHLAAYGGDFGGLLSGQVSRPDRGYASQKI